MVGINSDPLDPLGWGPEGVLGMEIFRPYALEKIRFAAKPGQRFVHYTSASTAGLILENKMLWMRQSSIMNDFSEIEFGTNCIGTAWSKHKELFDNVFGQIDQDFGIKLWEWFIAWKGVIRWQTFVACVSEHDETETKHGRLSMWRAYGGDNGVAMVLNNEPFLAASNALNAYSSPVAYHTQDTFEEQFHGLIVRSADNMKFLQSKGFDWVFAQMTHTLHFAMLCTKHRGFLEEREWRVVQSPAFGPAKNMKKSIRVVGGVPQTIMSLELKDIPEENLVGLEIPQLLDYLILGPTAHPMVIAQALAELLEKAGVDDPGSKIKFSDIPLRRT